MLRDNNESPTATGPSIHLRHYFFTERHTITPVHSRCRSDEPESIIVIFQLSVAFSRRLIYPERSTLKATALTFLTFAIACSVLAADDRHLRQVTGTPKLEAGYQSKYLVLENGKEPIRILWELDGSREINATPRPLFPVTLEPNTVYVFTVDEDEEQITFGDGTDRRVYVRVKQTLVRIARDGQIVYDQLDCAVHKRRMDRIKAEVVVGMQGDPGPHAPESILKERFPNYRDKHYAGCIDLGERTRLMYVCPDCKAAYLAWAAQVPRR